jgi:hypothetical protein
MTQPETPGRELAQGAGRLLAVAAGVVLMIVGLGMGVSVVLLPIGVPAGLFGLLLVAWGLSGRATQEGGPVSPPGSP